MVPMVFGKHVFWTNALLLRLLLLLLLLLLLKYNNNKNNNKYARLGIFVTVKVGMMSSSQNLFHVSLL